jgi:hypothetical protein
MSTIPSRSVAVRPLTPVKAVASAAGPAPVSKPKAQAAIKPQEMGARTKIGAWTGAVGGGITTGVVIGAPLMFFNALARGALVSPLAAVGIVAGAVVVGAVGGGLWGAAVGHVEDKVLDKVAKNNPTSQWGFYVSGYGLFHTGSTLLKGAATGLNGSLSGIGSVLGGAWQTAVEVKGLKEGGKLTDNHLRLGGAALATVGGLAAAAALVPAVAAAVPLIVPIGVGMAALGWGANLVGQFLNENRNEPVPRMVGHRSSGRARTNRRACKSWREAQRDRIGERLSAC